MKKILTPVITGFLMLLVGVGIGSSGSTVEIVPGETVTATATATATATETVQTEVTVTETVEASGVPQVCLDALDDAAEMMGYTLDFTTIFEEHIDSDKNILMDALILMDVAEMERYTRILGGHTDRIVSIGENIEASTMVANVQACRALAN